MICFFEPLCDNFIPSLIMFSTVSDFINANEAPIDGQSHTVKLHHGLEYLLVISLREYEPRFANNNSKLHALVYHSVAQISMCLISDAHINTHIARVTTLVLYMFFKVCHPRLHALDDVLALCSQTPSSNHWTCVRGVAFMQN